MNMIKKFTARMNKKVLAMVLTAIALLSAAIPAGAVPATGDTDLDGALTIFETSFATIKTGFWYLALAAIPITVAVLVFFWLRGKFKQSVSGA